MLSRTRRAFLSYGSAGLAGAALSSSRLDGFPGALAGEKRAQEAMRFRIQTAIDQSRVESIFPNSKQTGILRDMRIIWQISQRGWCMTGKE